MDRLLTIKDAPMFSRVIEDKNLCKGVIESILGIEIDHIEYQNTEEEISPSIDGRGVRLDAYVKATGQVFDIEIQSANEPKIGRRMRYYQSVIDSSLRDRGSSYRDLEESFIIFVCGYDPFNKDLPAYHLERTCLEDQSVEINDASHWIALNSTAWQKDDDVSRSNLLKFIQDGKANDELTNNLAIAVREANDDAEWRKKAMGFMTLEHHYLAREEEALERGIAEGEIRGEERMRALATKMQEMGASPEDIVDAMLSTDSEELFQKYGV